MIYWRLHEIMKEKDLTIEEVAIRTKIHRNIISRIKNNKQRRVDIDIIERLCFGLGLKPNDLFILNDEHYT